MTRVLTLLSVMLLASCASVSVTPDADVAVSADDNLNAVVWTQTAVEHDLIFREVYRQAQEKLLVAIADSSWDALAHDERDGDSRDLAPAVVLDVDETVLDNSPYQARLVRDGTEYNSESWAEWVREEKARALPGAVAFTRFADSLGVAVFYISNRDQALDIATLDNLRSEGFPVSGPEAFLGLGTEVPGCEQIGSEKTCRRRLIAEHHRVLMQFGDQLGDFLTVRTNAVQDRRDAVQPYLDWIGERWFVLPNATYGSWEPALFNNDWSLPREKRREAKRDALRIE